MTIDTSPTGLKQWAEKDCSNFFDAYEHINSVICMIVIDRKSKRIRDIIQVPLKRQAQQRDVVRNASNFGYDYDTPGVFGFIVRRKQ
jgi:hypothetical protein